MSLDFKPTSVTLLQRIAIEREKSRGYGRTVELTEEITENAAAAEREIGETIDMDWVKACHAAAVEHVLTKTALGSLDCRAGGCGTGCGRRNGLGGCGACGSGEFGE